jgi:aminoglycoside-2''-adenylyltransferase
MDLGVPTEFKEFLRLLRAEQVEYLLVGGWAVIYHGYPRPTNDFDIWIAVSEDNASRVARVFRKFGFDVAPPLQVFLEPDRVLRFGTEPNRIEIMTSASGVVFDDCYRQRLETTLDGEPVNLISLPNLRINKRAAGRLKDLADLEELPEAE